MFYNNVRTYGHNYVKFCIDFAWILLFVLIKIEKFGNIIFDHEEVLNIIKKAV